MAFGRDACGISVSGGSLVMKLRDASGGLLAKGCMGELTACAWPAVPASWRILDSFDWGSEKDSFPVHPHAMLSSTRPCGFSRLPSDLRLHPLVSHPPSPHLTPLAITTATHARFKRTRQHVSTHLAKSPAAPARFPTRFTSHRVDMH